MKQLLLSKPVRYFPLQALQKMDKWELIDIIKENGWEEMIGNDAKSEDWLQLTPDYIRCLIHTQMNKNKPVAKQ